MRYPVEWINDIVKLPDITDKKLSKELSLSGTEVESIEYPWNYIEGAVSARIEKVEEHPEADNLVITLVNTGEEKATIITSDKTVKEGDYVIAILRGGKIWDLEIREREFQGKVSEGMFMSLEEMKFEEKSERIFRFDQPVELGIDAKKLLKLNLPVIEVELTANRGDCLSILGISRELAAIFNKVISLPPAKCNPQGNNEKLTVKINDDGCIRYTALMLDNIRIKPSPLWLKRRLISAGLRPINNVVDITNYIMLETGHPVHAFDVEKIGGSKIVIRSSKEDEKITLLDGTEVELKPEDLLITNGNDPLALAGIMGGVNSGISEDTKNVLLEVAVFDPVRIRKTSRRLGITTDSSYRFERGVDSEDSDYVIKRLADLLTDLAEAKPVTDIVDEGKTFSRKKIHLRKWKVDQILGSVIPMESITEILKKLNFSLEENGDGWDVTVPSHRFDIEQENDLAEEIGRIYGYDKIKSKVPRLYAEGLGIPLELRKIRKLKNIMSSLGFFETVTYSFINPENPEKLGQAYKMLKNPLSLDMAALRPSLIYGLLDVASYNIRRQNVDLKFFEIGNVFTSDSKELKVLGMLETGMENPGDYTDKRDVSFYTFKGNLETVLKSLGDNFSFSKSEETFLEDRASFDIYLDGNKIGFAGIIDARIVEKVYDIKNQDVYVAEFELRELQSEKTIRTKKFTISQYPRVFRDLSFIVTQDMPYKKIEKAIVDNSDEILSEIKLKDIYMGKGIPEGEKSITITLVFESFEETLKDEKINASINKIVETIKTLGVRLRG
ncbi:MAG: phenylalanine--tRNA ligase subunit beta [Kosmotoga sp.]|nr:MAG: phenylalanine--tRNA ligase subunit beta [Kosmotoga sp.]